MSKMYTNKRIVETEDNLLPLPKQTDSEKRIKYLEERVRVLSEQVHRMASALELNNKNIRRQGSNINILGNALRSSKNG
jgi:septal ring factor EnvC (AmiA/AmiB activator)